MHFPFCESGEEGLSRARSTRKHKPSQKQYDQPYSCGETSYVRCNVSVRQRVISLLFTFFAKVVSPVDGALRRFLRRTIGYLRAFYF